MLLTLLQCTVSQAFISCTMCYKRHCVYSATSNWRLDALFCKIFFVLSGCMQCGCLVLRRPLRRVSLCKFAIDKTLKFKRTVGTMQCTCIPTNIIVRVIMNRRLMFMTFRDRYSYLNLVDAMAAKYKKGFKQPTDTGMAFVPRVMYGFQERRMHTLLTPFTQCCACSIL